MEPGSANTIEAVKVTGMTTSADFESALASNLRTFAMLNAEQARQDALRIAARIVRLVGCREYRVLELGDLLDIIDDADTDGIPTNELTSFENADIIIEATNRDDGGSLYIAVEASYTGNWRDVDRATRNAGYLTRSTGRPAHAVVAAQRIRPGIERLVERGEVIGRRS